MILLQCVLHNFHLKVALLEAIFSRNLTFLAELLIYHCLSAWDSMFETHLSGLNSSTPLCDLSVMQFLTPKRNFWPVRVSSDPCSSTRSAASLWRQSHPISVGKSCPEKCVWCVRVPCDQPGAVLGQRDSSCPCRMCWWSAVPSAGVGVCPGVCCQCELKMGYNKECFCPSC